MLLPPHLPYTCWVTVCCKQLAAVHLQQHASPTALQWAGSLALGLELPFTSSTPTFGDSDQAIYSNRFIMPFV